MVSFLNNEYRNSEVYYDSALFFQALDISIDFELDDIGHVNADAPWYLRRRKFQGYRAISLNCPIYDERFSRLADMVILSACALAAGVMLFSTNRFLNARSGYSQLRQS